MAYKHKQQLLDQLDDAAFALLMDEYAEAEGARLLKEFEMAPETIPEELDLKYRQMIRKTYAHQRRKHTLKKVLHKAAIVILVFLTLSVTTVMSVDALRIPVLNYIVEHLDRSSVIRFEAEKTGSDDNNVMDPLISVLPPDYVCVDFQDSDGMIYSMYTKEDGSFAIFHMTEAVGAYHFDTENGEYKEVEYFDYPAFSVQKDNIRQMIWIDEEAAIIYDFTVTGVSEDEFRKMCDILVLLLDDLCE